MEFKPKYFLNQLTQLISDRTFPPMPIYGVGVDSRLIKRGELFFALPGKNVNGHNFLSQVAKTGCEAAVVDQCYAGPDYGLVLVKTNDPLKALQEIARKLLVARHPQIVAVTGSVGKTTTKEWIKRLLKPKYFVGGTQGNQNSQIGLPLTILNETQGNEEILVLEMGMTQKGHIQKLVDIAPPDVALITKVALVHACNFNGLHDIAEAKAEIFMHPKTRLGVLDRQIENFEDICRVGFCQKLSFGMECPNADFNLTRMERDKFFFHCREGIFFGSSTKFMGKHLLHNLLGAVVIARHFKMEWEEIIDTIPSLDPPERRFEIIEKFGLTFVNDSYNASAIAIKAALEFLPEPKPGGKKIAVLSEMLELGKFSAECHASVGEFALDKVDKMVCFGEQCREIVEVWKKAGRSAELFVERSALINTLKNLLQPGDVVLLKGARAHEFWKLLEKLG